MYVSNKIWHMNRMGIPAKLSPTGAAISNDMLSEKKQRAKRVEKLIRAGSLEMHAFTFRHAVAPYLD